MTKKDVVDWVNQPKIRQVLISFFVPKTPRQIENELGIKKLKLKPFLRKHLIKSLNPGAKKGRFYILTDKTKRLLNLKISGKWRKKDWKLIGEVMSSPRQRLVVLKTLAMYFGNGAEITSEEIRKKANEKFNPSLTRVSTKKILKELKEIELVDSREDFGIRKTLGKRKKRYKKKKWMFYRINEKGKEVMEDINSISTLENDIGKL